MTPPPSLRSPRSARVMTRMYGKRSAYSRKDLRRLVARPVVDNDPERGRNRLAGDTVQCPPGILCFVTARGHQQIPPSDGVGTGTP